MPEPAARKFTMADLMILIAGCAAGIAWTQSSYRELLDLPGGVMEDSRIRNLYLVMSPTPILATIGMALLACRFRGPRPTLRRLCRQPGFVAIVCAVALLVLEGAMMLASLALNSLIARIWPPTPNPAVLDIGMSVSLSLLTEVDHVGLVIAACWLVLLAVGRWKPEPTWIDRAGRCLGATWIAMHIASTLTGA